MKKTFTRRSLLSFIPLMLILTPLLLGSGGEPSGCADTKTGVDAGVDGETELLDAAEDAAVDAGPYVPFCRLTLMGYFNATYTCAPVVAVYNSGTTGVDPGRTMVSTSVSVQVTGGLTIGVSPKFPGEIAVGVYTNGTGAVNGSGPTSGIGVIRGLSPYGNWVAQALQGVSQPMIGLYTMKITSVIPIFTTTNIHKYQVHGTIEATLPEVVPVNGTPQFDTVFMTVEF